MIMYFVGRQKELKWLEEEYKLAKPNLVIIYGRRRVGKTSLITRFLERKDSVYYLADESTSQEQLKQFSRTVSKWANVNILFNDWQDGFDFISKTKTNKKIVIAIDEFPYLISSDSAITSKFQKIWDEILSKKKIMLILLGSSVSIMENKVLADKSPLYGRRTSQIELRPFTISELKTFFRNNIEQTILKYGIVDGIPAYADKIKDTQFPECLNEMLSSNKYLYDEALFLLKEEFRETAIYKEILYAIANGRNDFGEIAQFSGLSGQKLPQYLKNLLASHLIKKEFPVTYKKEFRGAKYILSDNYFNFWFRYIYPYREALERGNANEVFDIIVKGYNEYVGKIFEKTIIQNLEKFTQFKFTKIGRWWSKDKEIDVIGLNETNNVIFFGEIKWSNNVDGTRLENELIRKAKEVKLLNKNKKEYFGIFVKSFKKRPKNALSFDLKQLNKLM